MRFDELAEINPSVKIKKGYIAPFIEMAALPQKSRDVTDFAQREFKGSGSRFENGDTLIARITPCLENGKGALVSCLPGNHPGFGSTEFIVARAREETDARFVYYVTRSDTFRKVAISRMEGTSGRQRVPWQQIASIQVPDLNPSAREEIGAILGILDDKIELNRKTAATLEAMARALYRSWFVDFDPVHARSQGLAPAHMDEATAGLFPDRFGDDELPEGWGICELSSVCDQNKKTVKPMESPDAPFLHFSLPAFDAGKSPVLVDGASIKSNKAFVPNNAVLFSRLNPRIPRVWWARTSGSGVTPVASTEFFIAVSKRSVDTPWLYCLLSSSEFRGDVLSRVTGTSNSHQRVPPKALAGIQVTSPSENVVEAFGTITGRWFERIQTLAAENETLATLRDTLLPRLMSGELRVREAREQVEDVV